MTYTLTPCDTEAIVTRIMTTPICKAVVLWRGLYARAARKAGCHASYVSRIANGERRSRTVEGILRREYRSALAKTVRLKSR
jgi:hypothetical protein